MKNFEWKNELLVIDGNQYRINLAENGNCVVVYASPCLLPSCVFEVAEVCRKENCCSEFEFYEAMIYTDPVQCIIDCSFCEIVRRAVEIYVDDIDLNTGNQRRCGFFGF